MAEASPLPPSLSQVCPELTMDVVTLIIQFAQDLESPYLWHALTHYPFQREKPAETLKRIQALLKKGLVSKLWRDAISDPRLWTTFLNASMNKEQFLRVVARSGHLPVTISFNPKNSTVLSDDAIEAIVKKAPRITGLLLDISTAAPSPLAPTLHLRAIMSTLKNSMPSLRTLSLSGGEGPNPELSVLFSSNSAFSGVAPPIRTLELSGITISPCTFGTSIVSLVLVFTDFTHFHAQLGPWAKLSKQGDMPALKELRLRAWPWALRNEPQAPEYTEKKAIPSTLDSLIIEGDIATCLYMGAVLSHPIPVGFEILASYDRGDSESVRELAILFAYMRASTSSEYLDLEITDDRVSIITPTAKPATLAFVATNPRDANHMLCCVMSQFFGELEVSDLNEPYKPAAFEDVCVTLDISLHRRTLLSPHDDDELPQLLESFSMLLDGLKEMQNVEIMNYDILGNDSTPLVPWQDALNLLQIHKPEGSTRGGSFPFHSLRTLSVLEPVQGISREFHSALSRFVWEHHQSRLEGDEGAVFECLEIAPYYLDLPEIVCDPSTVKSREDWDVLYASVCKLDSIHT